MEVFLLWGDRGEIREVFPLVGEVRKDYDRSLRSLAWPCGERTIFLLPTGVEGHLRTARQASAASDRSLFWPLSQGM